MIGRQGPILVTWQLSRASRAEERLDLARSAGGREEIALADAAARFGEEVALRLGFDAFRDDLEVEAAGKGDQRTSEACALAVVRHAREQAAVDADGARAQTLQHRQRGVAGAEVVDAEARTVRGDLAERLAHGLRELAHAGLGHLDEERIGWQTARLERLAHLLADAAGAQLARAQIDHDGEGPVAVVHPAPALDAGLAQDPAAEPDEKAAVLCERQERVGREHAVTRVAPPQQRLGADHLPRRDVEARLVDEEELA